MNLGSFLDNTSQNCCSCEIGQIVMSDFDNSVSDKSVPNIFTDTQIIGAWLPGDNHSDTMMQ